MMAQYFFDLLYTFTDCMCCFSSSPQLKVNNRSFKLLRLLGEVRRIYKIALLPGQALVMDVDNGLGRILLCLPRSR